MARASARLSEWVEIPHEPGNEMRFRALPWHVLEAAKAKKMDDQLALSRALPTSTAPKTSEDRERLKRELMAELAEHPGDEYDARILLAGHDGHPGGLAAWRGPLYTNPDNGQTVPVDGLDLDPVTSRWAADEIVRQSNPSAVTVGKGLSPSTAS